MQFMNEARQRVMELVQENATTILTAGGVFGTVTTGVLAWRGGYQTGLAVATHEAEVGLIDSEGDVLESLTKTDKIKLAALDAIPPIISGGATIGAIVMSHRISAQKAATMAALYGLSQDRFEEYRAKVQEKLTGPKAQAIDDAVAQDRVNNTPGSGQIVVIEGEVLCFDATGGRYFLSTMEKIKQAVNKANEDILNYDSISLSEFYDKLGLKPTRWSDDVGFNMDNRVDLKYSTTLAENNKPCISIDFVNLPVPDFHRQYHG